MALAISTGQPYRDVCRWTDEEIATAWDLIDRARSKTDTNTGGVRYSG